MNIHLLITAPFRKMRAPKNLPVLSRGEAEAAAWFQGYWVGIGVGVLIGLGSGVLAGMVMGIM